jgi:pyruvate formate lyase activating enzyme
MPGAKINLIPYHALGTAKYERLNRKYPAQEVKAPGKEEMQKILNIFSSYNIQASIV